MACHFCQNPLAMTKPEYQLCVETPAIVIFQCPQCGQLILDDIYGWKGSGFIAPVTEQEIAVYLKTQQWIHPNRRTH